jgi:hypothetical protein
MQPDETPPSGPPTTKAEPTAPPSDADLSRIAREAVRQPADPRLDKQLAWMGLTDDPAAAATPVAAAPAAPPAVAPVGDATLASEAMAAKPDLALIEARLNRLAWIVWTLVVAVVILAVAVVVLLFR